MPLIIKDNKLIEVSSISDYSQTLKQESLLQRIPYVKLIRKHGNSIGCELGYIDRDGVHNDEDIKLGHVIVRSIYVSIKKDQYEFPNISFDSEFPDLSFDHNVYYHYTITFCICGRDDFCGLSEYTFKKTDCVIYKDNGEIKKNNKYAIEYFFTYIVPLINSDIDSGINPKQLNVDYYKQKYKDGNDNNFSYNKYPLSVDIYDVLDIVYSVQVEVDPIKESTIIARFENKEGKIYNLYTSALIGEIIETTVCKKEEENKIIYLCEPYKWSYKNKIPIYLKYDKESFKNFILKKLYIGILLNYDQEKADKGFRYAVSLNRIKNFDLDEYSSLILDFILGLRATLFEDGRTRVGRDDIGWEEEIVLLPIKPGFKPSLYFIELINSTLNINLEKQENNMCYYYRHESDHEYIAGSARRKDIGSFGHQRFCIHKLIKTIVPMLIKQEEKLKLIDL